MKKHNTIKPLIIIGIIMFNIIIISVLIINISSDIKNIKEANRNNEISINQINEIEYNDISVEVNKKINIASILKVLLIIIIIIVTIVFIKLCNKWKRELGKFSFSKNII